MRRRDKFRVMVAFLVSLHAALLAPGFFAPYDPAEQNRDLGAIPPTRLHFVDAQGHFHLRPFVYGAKFSASRPDEILEDRGVASPLRFFARGARYRVAGLFTADVHALGVEAPARLFLAGTDDLGRDLFSRIVFGARLTLFAGLLATALSLSLGLLIGGIAGFCGGWMDSLLMRATELFLAVPWIFLLFAMRAVLPLRMSAVQTFLLIVAVIGLVGWARPARLVRGVALSAREREFVSAARGFGATNSYLLRRHILPQTLPVVWTQAALLVPQFVLAEVLLSFLGLGVGEPSASLGNLLSSLQQAHVLQTEWWMYAPALALAPVFLAYHLVSNALASRVKSIVS